MDENDIIDISMDFNDNWNKSKQTSSNFGGGIELLMNENRGASKTKFNEVDFNDVSNLEDELNNLANEPINLNYDDTESHVRFGDTLGESTINLDNNAKTWDGYGKFNDIPSNNNDMHIPTEPKMSANEILKEKVKYLRKFEALEKKGVQLTKKYDMDSNLNEMKGEYEMIMDDKARQNSVKFQANMMMTIVNGIEYLNQKFDPFDVNLDGWGEQIQENITDYDEVFGALHDKWKSKVNVSPELQLLFQLGGSAVMVHMTNSLFKSSMPNMDDILKQNPDLMRQFQNAAVNSMNNSSPGFSSFMNDFTSQPQQQTQQRPQTQSIPRQNMREQVRPDISMARGVFANVDDGINIQETNASVPFERSARKEMKGPSNKGPIGDMKGPNDLGDILSGLKTKKINVNENMSNQIPVPKKPIREETPPTIQLTSLSTMDYDTETNLNDSSRISVDDIKNIEGDFNLPKKTRRKLKSDKNVIDLNLDF
jgi:hypothetical protein